jgi:hypothetical protein
MGRLKELQSVLNGEVEKVRQPLREAKESADSATDIGLANRAVAEDAQKKAEAHLERVSPFEAEVFALRSALVPAQRAAGDRTHVSSNQLVYSCPRNGGVRLSKRVASVASFTQRPSVDPENARVMMITRLFVHVQVLFNFEPSPIRRLRLERSRDDHECIVRQRRIQ